MLTNMCSLQWRKQDLNQGMPCPKHMLLTTSQLSDNIMPPICCLWDYYNGDTMLETNYPNHMQNSLQASSPGMIPSRKCIYFSFSRNSESYKILYIPSGLQNGAMVIAVYLFMTPSLLILWFHWLFLTTASKKHTLFGLQWLNTSNYLSSSTMEPRNLNVHRIWQNKREINSWFWVHLW